MVVVVNSTEALMSKVEAATETVTLSIRETLAERRLSRIPRCPQTPQTSREVLSKRGVATG